MSSDLSAASPNKKVSEKREEPLFPIRNSNQHLQPHPTISTPIRQFFIAPEEDSRDCEFFFHAPRYNFFLSLNSTFQECTTAIELVKRVEKNHDALRWASDISDPPSPEKNTEEWPSHSCLHSLDCCAWTGHLCKNWSWFENCFQIVSEENEVKINMKVRDIRNYKTSFLFSSLNVTRSDREKGWQKRQVMLSPFLKPSGWPKWWLMFFCSSTVSLIHPLAHIYQSTF